MQGGEGVSLTGLLSCTIDSVETGEGKRTRAETGNWAKDGKGKAETTNAVPFNM